MYYEKDSRTFNLLAGLVLGAVLGAGLAFLGTMGRKRRGRRRTGH